MPLPNIGPASLQALLLQAYNANNSSLLQITGARGSGKTRWCGSAAAFARMNGWPVVGFLSPAVIQDGHKIGIDLLDLAGGGRRRLAVRRCDDIAGAHGHSGGDICIGSWRFCTEAVAWGNRILQSVAEVDVLILDELGPLELRQGRGIQAALSLLDARRYRVACVTVRPQLLPAMQARWPWGRRIALDTAAGGAT